MKRWMVAYGEYVKAAEKTVAAIQRYLDYVPVCKPEPLKEFNVISLKVDKNIKGVKILVSEAEGESQYIEIIGQDDINLLYAVADFKNIYLPAAHCSDTSNTPYFFNRLFSNPLKPYCYSSAPKIRENTLSILSLPISLYPYPVVVVKSLSDIFSFLNALNTFKLFKNVLLSILLKISFISNSESFTNLTNL